MKSTNGFTLSEVLISIVVIGIISAITIPNLLKELKYMQYEESFRKTYSVFNQAVIQLTDEFGGNWLSVLGTSPSSASVTTNLCTKLQCIKNCGAGNINSQCWTLTNIKNLNGTPYNLDYSTLGFTGMILVGNTAILSDGTFISIRYTSSYTDVIIDVDGAKGSHMMGRDVYRFSISPTGKVEPRTSVSPSKSYCTTKTTGNSKYNGVVCAFFVLQGQHVSDI